MIDPIELQGQWYEALKARRPDLTEEQLREEVLRRAAEGFAPITAIAARKAAEDAFDLSYVDEAKLWFAWRVIQKKGLPVMKVWLARFWNDPAWFAAAMRGIIVTVCQLVVQGVIVVPWIPQAAWFAGVVVGGLAVGIPAGQKNQPPEEIKAIAVDPTIVATKVPGG